MENSEKMLEVYFNAATKRTVFASFNVLRNVNENEEQTFADFVLNFREDDMFKSAKEAGVDMAQLGEEILSAYQKNSDLLMKRIAIGLALAMDDSKKFQRKKKEEKK